MTPARRTSPPTTGARTAMSTQTLPDPNGRTVGEIAATVPGATGVFRKFKVDFCCGGDVTLAEAARQRGLRVSALEEALHALEGPDEIGRASRRERVCPYG